MTIYTAGVTRMMKRKLIILTEIESDKLLNMMRLLMIAALFLLTQQLYHEPDEPHDPGGKTGAAQPSQFR